MATETNSGPKSAYRYIDTDIDRDYLIKNLNHNAQAFAKSRGWSMDESRVFYDALDEYVKAIEDGRISSGRDGSLTDSAGILDNGSADRYDSEGNALSVEQYGSMSDRKKKNTHEFYGNRAVASYVDIIAKSIYDKAQADKTASATASKSSAKSPKFDFSKYGLWPGFTNSLSPGGAGDLSAYYDLDQPDPKTKKRPTTGRAKLFSDYITTYMGKLPEDLDFSTSVYGDRESYVRKLQELQQALSDGVTSDDYRKMQQLGISPDDYRMFFTEDETYTPGGTAATGTEAGTGGTEETGTEEAGGAAQQAQSEREYLDKLRKANNESYNAWVRSGQTAARRMLPNAANDSWYDASSDNLLKSVILAAGDHGLDFNSAPNWLPTTAGSKGVTVAHVVDALYRADAKRPADQASMFTPITTNTVATGKYVLSGSLNPTSMTALVYDPSRRSTRREHLSKIADDSMGDNDTIFRELRLLLETKIGKSYPTFLQEGGSMPVGSDFDSARDVFRQLAQYQSTPGLWKKEYPLERQMWNKDATPLREAGAITGADIARIGAILGDIGAVVDPEPFSSAGLGLASSIATLGADLSEGQGMFTSLGTFAANVGLSALGVVPVFGDALGNGTKIVKSLTKLAPKITPILMGAAATGALANAQPILHSFSKIGKNGPENEMSMQDWRNIATGLQLILGGAQAARSYRAIHKVRKLEGQNNGYMDVRVTDKNGNRKILRFAGEKDVEALRKASSPEDVYKVIDGHPSFSGRYTVDTKSVTTHSWFGNNSKWYKPWSWRSKNTSSVLGKGAVREGADYKAVEDAVSNGSLSGRTKVTAQKYTPTSADVVEVRDYLALPLYRRPVNSAPRSKPNPIEGTPAPAQPAGPRAALPAPRTEPASSVGPRATAPEAAPAGEPWILPQHPTMGRRTALPPPRTEPATPMRSPEPSGNPGVPKNPVHQSVVNARYAYKTKERLLQNTWLSGGNLRGVPKSPAGAKLQKEYGWSDDYMLRSGLWKEGGKFDSVRKIAKGQSGLKLFGNGSLNTDRWWSDINLDRRQSFFGTGALTKPELTAPATSNYTKSYGTGYTSSLDYSGKEYGQPVNISGIEKHNAMRRPKDLATAHGAEGYDYTNAQVNTDAARQKWIESGGREKDLGHAMTEWFKENPGKPIGDFLADYNRLVDKQYVFKRGQAAPEKSGDNAYRRGEDIREFNRGNKWLYDSANSPGGVQGYNSAVDDWNGTQTAQRFIDITPDEVPVNPAAMGSDVSDDIKRMAGTLVKDPTGRYYTVSRGQPTYTVPSVSDISLTLPDGALSKTSRTEPDGGGEDIAKKEPKEFNFNFGQLAADLIPLAKYLNDTNLNKKLLENARRMPVALYDPKERFRWIRGDQAAVQEGFRQAGEINRVAAEPVTSDADRITAARLEGAAKAAEAIRYGYAKNDAAVQASTEANWTQAGLNQDSRHTTAMGNRSNLIQREASVLQAEDAYRRANAESLDNLLDEFRLSLNVKNEERKRLQESVEMTNIRNSIKNDLGAYGIAADKESQQLINDLQSGVRKLSELSDGELLKYKQIANAIDQKAYELYYAKKGVDYVPYVSKRPEGFTPTLLDYKKSGGRMTGADYITIQRMRNKIEKLKLFQRHIEKKMDSFQRDLDRAQRSMSQYITGQMYRK